MRILIVEDDETLADGLSVGLRLQGFTPELVTCCADAREALAQGGFSAVVLDLMLPDGSGLDLLAALRAGGDRVPVLLLTALDQVRDRIGGLDAGADDYLLKPFAMEELIARLRALLRRPGQALGRKLTAGNVEFDTVAREVSVGGVPAVFSRRETDLLEILLRRQGRVVPKDAIEEGLYAFGDEVSSNTVEVAVHRLRKRLADAGADIEVHTLRGIGYVLSPAT